MKSLASFASLLAIGLLVGGFIMLITTHPEVQGVKRGAPGASWLDFRSMLIGLLLGLMLSNLSRVPWADLPRLIVSWVLSHSHRFEYATVATILVAIIIFY